MLRLIKIFLSSVTLISLLIALFYVYDMTNVDVNYVNRGIVNIDAKNINSSKSYKINKFLRKNYLYYRSLFSEDFYQKKLAPESQEERLKLDKKKIIKAKKSNFALPKYEVESYYSESNWLRSNGNDFSTRFSGLKKINSKNVKNLSLAWKYSSKSSNTSKEYQANVVVENGVVFTPTPNNDIVAIDGKHGKELWNFKVDDGIAAKRGMVLWKNKSEDYSRIFFTDNKSKLYSINSKNGKPIDSFGKKGFIKVGVTPIPPIIYNESLIVVTTDSVIKSYNILRGKIKWKYKLKEDKPSIIFENFNKGSPWGGFAIDKKRGLLFITTGNPQEDYIGIDRPGKNLYANSLVAFDLNKKKIRWYFQEVAHDIWNMDLAAPPILTMIKKYGLTFDVVVAVSKLGNTLIFDRDSGKPIYDIIMERAPVSTIPGERTSSYQPNIKLPEPICRNKFKIEYLTKLDKVNYKNLLERALSADTGFPNPYKIGKESLQISSCVRWAGATIDTKKNIMYVSNDQIAYMHRIVENEDRQLGYGSISEKFVDNNGYFAIEPPWGSLVALNLNNGKIVWKVPLGEYEELTKMGVPPTGTPNRAGATATAGGLVFVSGTEDKKIRAFDAVDGKILWEYKLPFMGSAPPTLYSIEDKQYMVVPAFENGGNTLLSFSITN